MCQGLIIITDTSIYLKESEEMRSNSLDSKLKAKEVELKRHEQEIADQDEVWYLLFNPSSCTFLVPMILTVHKLLSVQIQLKLCSAPH